MEYQRGTTPVDAYYDVALTILDGDAGSLLALAGKLPDEAKKAELLAFHERRTREAAAAAAAEAQAQAAAAARAAEAMEPTTSNAFESSLTCSSSVPAVPSSCASSMCKIFQYTPISNSDYAQVRTSTSSGQGRPHERGAKWMRCAGRGKGVGRTR